MPSPDLNPPILSTAHTPDRNAGQAAPSGGAVHRTPDVSRLDASHRKALGQFFTPPGVAGFMVRWVLASGQKSLFDPAFGLGAFCDAIPRDSGIEFSALEVDPAIVEFWERETGASTAFIAVENYLLSWGRRHANIVCNPPYMRFQNFPDRNAVIGEFRRRLGLRLSGYTNVASAFLLKSLSELEPRGRMAYIMPLEFLNTGYGTIVKERLLAAGHLFAVIRLDCEKDVFPDAITSVGVILYDNAATHASVQFYAARSIAELAAFDKMEPVSEVPCNQLDPASKWLPFFQRREFQIHPARATTLDTFGRFGRGIATGANEFFVLRPSDAEAGGKAGGIDRKSECVPCITRSAQIRGPVFDAADYDALYAADKPVLLFSATDARAEGAERYIRFGEGAGFHKRYLTKSRKPWYKTEKRRPAPLLLGVFSRGGYKVVLNRSDALNLTCFHGFQPNGFGRRYVERLFLYLASQTGRDIVSLSMRKYGDSLDKFEPNDLNGAWVPTPDLFDSIPAQKVAEAMAATLETGAPPQWFEAFFAPLKIPGQAGPNPRRR